MKVFLLFSAMMYEGSEIIAVFSSWQLAKDNIPEGWIYTNDKEFYYSNVNNNTLDPYYQILELELDKAQNHE